MSQTTAAARAASHVASSLTLPPVRVLITGFEPFDADQDGALDANTSFALPKRLATREEETVVEHPSGKVLRATLSGAVLPVTWSASSAESARSDPGAADKLEALVRARRPHVLIATGMRGTPFTVDRTAYDLDGAGLPDNRGVRFDLPRRQVAADDAGPEFAIPTTLPADAIEEAWEEAAVPWRKSDTAGKYICNDVFYRAVWLQSRGSLTHRLLAAGFVHIPMTATTDMVEKAIAIVVREALEALDVAGLGVLGAGSSRRR